MLERGCEASRPCRVFMSNQIVVAMEELPIKIVILLLVALAALAVGLALTFNQKGLAESLVNLMTGSLQSLIAK